MRTVTHTLATAAVAALCLALSACTGDADDDPTATGQSSVSPEESTLPEEPTAIEDATPVSGPECLIGTWELPAGALEEQTLAQLGGTGEVDAEGSSSITYDGATQTTTTDSRATYDAELDGVSSAGSTEAVGTFVTGYTADEDSITVGDVVSAEGGITITDETSGTLELPFSDTASAQVGVTQRYACSADELTLITEIADTSVEQTLTRAG